MSDALQAIAQHVNRLLSEQTHPLFLHIDNALRLISWRGDAQRYGLSPLQEGTPMDDALPIVSALDPSDTAPRDWPFIDLPNGIVTHAHILHLDDGWGIALLDASEEHAELQTRQQVAHELTLLRNEREQLVNELRDANRQKDEFISRMSHEFRTPLSSVMGYSDQLREMYPDDPRIQKNLAAVGRGARYLVNLVENLIDQALIENQQFRLNPTVCNVRDLVEELDEMFAPLADQKHLTLNWDIGERVPDQVSLDPTRLKQVLINLVGNAIKFTRHGGVNIDMRWQDQRLDVTVTDTGPGIAVGDRATLFQPFRQGGQSVYAKGAGLGLAISRALVRAMGGDIDLHSQPGQGARFAFSVHAQGSESADPHDEKPLRGRQVVVADDDEDLLELFRLYLTSAGCNVYTAHDAGEAIAKTKAHRPDAVLIDLNLGDDDGLETAARLRQNGHITAIVLLTADNSAALPNDQEQRLVDDRWTKPINRNELITRLAGLMP